MRAPVLSDFPARDTLGNGNLFSDEPYSPGIPQPDPEDRKQCGNALS